MKYAWIENERVRDICQGGNPEDCYTPDVALHYDTLVSDETQNGWIYIDGKTYPPEPEENIIEDVFETNNGTTPDVIG